VILGIITEIACVEVEEKLIGIKLQPRPSVKAVIFFKVSVFREFCLVNAVFYREKYCTSRRAGTIGLL